MVYALGRAQGLLRGGPTRSSMFVRGGFSQQIVSIDRDYIHR